LPAIEPICEALKQHRTFGFVEVSRIEIKKFGAQSVSAVAEEYKKFADPEIMSLHLDHIPVVDEDGMRVDWEPFISEGISCGYDSVMIDGSRLPFEENVEVTARVVEMAHAKNVLVEAELGAVLGHESGPMPSYDELFASRLGFTDPDQAQDFVKRTNVDWLSVSVGSIHGAIAGATMDAKKMQARIDIGHLKKLRDATAVPLVLHGGSGVIRTYIDQAIQNGITKINIGTDVRQPYDRVIAAGGSISEAQAAIKETVSTIILETFHIEDSASRLNAIGYRLNLT
jgi:ketose-bisphosphate aldolase